MRSIDTNVLARWVLGDHPVQSTLAANVLSQPVFVPLTVLLELGWVLYKALGLGRNVAAEMLEQVIDLETALVERGELARWAVARFRQGADWADMMHLAAASVDSIEFATFDRRLARHAGADSPVPVCLVGGKPAE